MWLLWRLAISQARPQDTWTSKDTMNIRRNLTVAAASLIALSATITPAHAQELNLGDVAAGTNAINQLIDSFPCEILKPMLTQTGLVNGTTTRSELANTLKDSANLNKLDISLAFAGVLYSNRIADRALTCGAVQPDPQQDILVQLQNMLSNLSS